MAKIRHLAIVSRDPNKLADFYADVFGLTVQHRSETGAVYMTDGYINLALLPNRASDMASGINHFGFAVDDTAEIAEKLKKHGVIAPTVRPANRPYAEHRAMDIDGNLFDLSVHGFQREEYRAEREPELSKSKEKVEEGV